MAGSLPRTLSRRAAVQALYQALVNNQQPEQDALEFVTAEYADKIDKKYFKVLVEGAFEHLDEIDAALSDAVDRSLSSVDPVEASILRVATFEYLHRPDIPYRVVLNEAVELAKSFGGEQGHKYVNGVLDKVAVKARPDEYRASKKRSK